MVLGCFYLAPLWCAILGSRSWVVPNKRYREKLQHQPGWSIPIGYIGDEKLPSYIGIIINHEKVVIFQINMFWIFIPTDPMGWNDAQFWLAHYIFHMGLEVEKPPPSIDFPTWYFILPVKTGSVNYQNPLFATSSKRAPLAPGQFLEPSWAPLPAARAQLSRELLASTICSCDDPTRKYLSPFVQHSPTSLWVMSLF